MTYQDSVWIGADPGGDSHFGLAILKSDGSVRTWCVNCADEAVTVVVENVNATPNGFGVDAPLWWSSGVSGGRSADQWIRDKYGQPTSSKVLAINSLQGAALAQGMMFVKRIRECFPDANVTETHPKALLSALNLNGLGFYQRYRVETQANIEHERDAIISAVAAREGFAGRWTNDLIINRRPSEQDPSQFWLAPVHYFWPEA
ncbi:MAG: DUF429 domain-containing protein [Nitrospirota bacterium]